MKLTHILAAGLLMAGVGISTEAAAQTGHGRGDRWDHRDNDRGDRHDGRWGRHDNGRHNGWRNHRRDCRIVWRHHQRMRVCR